MTTAYIVVAVILAACGAAMVWGLWEIEVYLVCAAGRLLWRFCRWMCRNPKRNPSPAHPSVRATRIRLSDEEVRRRIYDIAEGELKRGPGVPDQRNGDQR
jgi:hypothetical protein